MTTDFKITQLTRESGDNTQSFRLYVVRNVGQLDFIYASSPDKAAEIVRENNMFYGDMAIGLEQYEENYDGQGLNGWTEWYSDDGGDFETVYELD